MWHKFRKIALLFIIIISVVFLEYNGILQCSVARISSYFYINKNYPNEGLKFDNAGMVPYFGHYSAVYKNKEGKSVNLRMSPDQFPIFIVTDSRKGEG